MESLIIVDRLSKDFEVNHRPQGVVGTISSLFSPIKKTIHALKDVSFNIQKGELVGFIGPNGAGKTTALKVLSGLLYPSSGFVSVKGYNPWDKNEKFLKQIALVMGQKNQLWWDLPVIDSLELNKVIYEINDKEYLNTLKVLTDLLDVSRYLNTPVRKLSLGQRMKMELVASLIYKPEVLFLDEPTLGLDLVAQKNLRDFIFEYNKKNEATILLTSHNMTDLVDLSRRVIVINEGQIIYDGALEQLSNKFAIEKEIKLTLSTEISLDNLKKIGKIKNYKYPEVSLIVPRSAVTLAASEILQNFDVLDLNIEEMPIEDVIRSVFQEENKSG